MWTGRMRALVQRECGSTAASSWVPTCASSGCTTRRCSLRSAPSPFSCRPSSATRSRRWQPRGRVGRVGACCDRCCPRRKQASHHSSFSLTQRAPRVTGPEPTPPPTPPLIGSSAPMGASASRAWSLCRVAQLCGAARVDAVHDPSRVLHAPLRPFHPSLHVVLCASPSPPTPTPPHPHPHPPTHPPQPKNRKHLLPA